MRLFLILSLSCLGLTGCRGPGSQSPETPLATRVEAAAVARGQADLPCEETKARIESRSKAVAAERFDVVVVGCGLEVLYEAYCGKRTCDLRMSGSVHPEGTNITSSGEPRSPESSEMLPANMR